MARPNEHKAFSYREDPNVPDFDDDGLIAVMDGDCAVCSLGARLIARFDRREQFKICIVQSQTGTALVEHYGLDPQDPETWLFLENGKAWSGMEAIIRIGEGLGGIGRVSTAMRILPQPFREWLYRRIARNRYRFGRTDMCALPDERLRRRLMNSRKRRHANSNFEQ
ncbi:thiol-disulfide oxidoreductase DCC family protein [Aestuariicoccus sp. MJ-SS9]|uniref:thiol-disulfide oxidoreductase DCC family protein n=1 Tax=Aestuariicoccus sp. MJ-SS9 TaxID=3079855 RepID=UPI00290B50E9|nr:DCC1-like thiol-disulfide oxidoreductase family protein [Aestuariicoccus sp. MJ-SS9]MDU8913388.1 DCC1-like thiol-disulfide oxidoreductase family protein [Aestuariicoccus sp. MJ-SS9]